MLLVLAWPATPPPTLLVLTPTRRALTQGAAQLAAACPAAHPLLPTAPAGLMVVSCTAKGKAMHGRLGVEAELIHAATKVRLLPLVGGRSNGSWGPALGALPSAAGACTARLRSPPALTGCHPPCPLLLQMPFAGFYADGEIGPEVTNGRSALRWAGGGGGDAGSGDASGSGGAGGSSAGGAAAAAPAARPHSALQGFTSVLTSLGAAPT